MLTTAAHTTHALMLAVPALAFAMLFAAEWRRTADSPLPWSLRLAVLGSGGAGVVHVVVVPHHASEHPVLGWFFALLAVAQLGWSVAVLVGPVRRVVVVGALGNLGVVLLWAWSRAVGTPFGHREPFTPLDLTATALEVTVVLACLVWVRGQTVASAGAEVLVAGQVDIGRPS